MKLNHNLILDLVGPFLCFTGISIMKVAWDWCMLRQCFDPELIPEFLLLDFKLLLWHEFQAHYNSHVCICLALVPQLDVEDEVKELEHSSRQETLDRKLKELDKKLEQKETMLASVTWQVLFVAFFATVASKYVQGYYQASARELMRINGTTKAPIMNYAAETSLGVVTIRAFNMANRFFQNYLKLVDNDAKLFFYSYATMEWLILRVEALQNLTLFTAVFPWFYFPRVMLIQFMHIPPEPPAIVEDRRPPSSWPSEGRIELQDLRLKLLRSVKTATRYFFSSIT
ncbi:hypothetical protein ACSBR1_030293 [Camellia fascicularis]